jgi:hypothetical protein
MLPNNFVVSNSLYIYIIQAMGKLRQRYDELKERYGVSDITVSVQSKVYHPFGPNFISTEYL